MRKLMWFTIGFTAACAVCSYGMMYAWLPPVALVCMTAAITAVCLLKRKSILRPAVAVLTGCAAGLCWFGGYHHLFLKPVTALDGQKVHLSITAADYSYETGYGIGVDGMISIEGKSYQIRSYIQEEITLQPGDRVEGSFRLRITAAEEENPSTYFQGKGIFLMAYQQGAVQLTKGESGSWRYIPAVLRNRILSILEEILPADASPFGKALLLGDGRGLDYATDTAFKVSGIRHIIAVSGLHISILYGLIAVVTFRKRYLTALIGIPVLFLFAAVAGFAPSVTRACIMVWLMMAAMVFDREYDPATALAFAVLVMLLCNPLAVTSVSLQLSAGCVAGILLFNEPINSWLQGKLGKRKGIAKKFQAMFCSSVSVTLSAMSLVTPLSALYFGAVSLVGVITNLLTLWVVNLIFNGLVIALVIYPVSSAAAAVLGNILAWPIRYVLGTAKVLASVPLASVYTVSLYIVFWLVFVYLLLAVFLVMKKKQPFMLFCCAALGLCICLLASWLEPLTADTSITMLDVGQGQAILLQSEGKTFLVDCGGDDDEETADIIAETLLSQGISRLDGIVLTHYDRDHAGAIHHLLTRLDTDYLFLPDTRNDFAEPETDGTILYIWEDLKLCFGEACLTIYGPVYSGLDNENSLCVLFDTEKCDILITGDRTAFGERMLMRQADLPDVDILVAGHHGAADSTSEELLRAVQPETVLISVKENNLYGHPSDQLLQRLKRFDCTVFRTDHHGTITIRR